MTSVKLEIVKGTVLDPNLDPVAALHTHLKAALELINGNANARAGSGVVDALKPLLTLAIADLAKVAPAADCSRDTIAGIVKALSTEPSAAKFPAITPEERKHLQMTVTAVEATLHSIHREREKLHEERDLVSKTREELQGKEQELKHKEEELHLLENLLNENAAVRAAAPAVTQDLDSPSPQGVMTPSARIPSATELLGAIRVEAGRLRKKQAN